MKLRLGGIAAITLLVLCASGAQAQQAGGAADDTPAASGNAAPAAWGEGQPAQGMAVVTLGTAGGPPPHEGRSQPATLLEVDGHQYLIDAGEGVRYQMRQIGIVRPALDAVFITHLHWDHVLGLDYLMASDWMQGRTVPLPILGPPGAVYWLSRVTASVEVGADIFASQADPRPPIASLFPVQTVASCDPAQVFADDTVTVTAVCNTHFAEVRSADHSYGEDRGLSYRFDTAHGSITFTGDTGPSEALAELAKGSDVLVSEIVDIDSIAAALRAYGQDNPTLLQHMAHQHLTPEEVGRLATAAGVKTVILTHFVMGSRFNPDDFAAKVKAYFDGEVIVGHDLARYPVSVD